MLPDTLEPAYEAVEKKRRRDGLRRLIEAGAITAALRATAPLPGIAVERLCEDHLRVADRAALHASGTVRTDEFGAPETTRFECPESDGPLPETIEAVPESIEWDRPFVAVVPEGRLLGHTALGYSPDEGVVLETAIAQRRILERDLRKHPLSVARLLAGERGRSFGGHIGTGVEYDELVALPTLYSNYYHWVQNSLPRLEGVRRYEEMTGREPPLLIRKDPPMWLTDSLDVLGFGPERRIEWDRKLATVSRLVVPSFRRLEFRHPARRHTHIGVGFRNLAVPGSACAWLREAATADVPTGGDRRIYVSRADAHKRRVVNEEAVMAELEDRGFERYVLSELSFREQVELFANAGTVVAPHGAGLVNTLFASECRIVELAPEPIRPTFFMLARSMGFDYEFRHCESVGRQIRVDIDDLREALS